MKVYAGNVVEKKTSLYVGKIPEGLEDESVKALLDNCGTVVSWKRVMDAETKKPKGFGFCEYEKAEHVMRSLRILNGLKIGPAAELLLKVDSKTQAYLDDYVKRSLPVNATACSADVLITLRP
ncbi:hypothetical protein T484DRAFT_1625826 [Baffinella frigidus]|nr:hypothetical protein T484DRAFT_1625826 [Cryptophyta sp. CCMP2293]